MNPRSLPVCGVALLALLSLLFALAACGADSAASSPSVGSSPGASAATPARAGDASQAWAGLWIDDKQTYLHFAADGRYSSFRLEEARGELRHVECGQNKYGERTLPTLNKAAGWDLVGEQLVAFKRPLDPKRADERIAGRSFRRLTAKEKRAYWEVSAHRLVRTGQLDEIVAAEQGGFDFARVVDPDIDVATEGQPLYVDMLSHAVVSGQAEVARHFLDRGLEPHADAAVRPAVALGDAALLGRLLDHGMSAAQALEAAILVDAAPAMFEVAFDHGATAEPRHLDWIDAEMKTHKDAVRAMFEARLK